jgi:outer membrane protein assembly factor BamD (BamD/ComL family)
MRRTFKKSSYAVASLVLTIQTIHAAPNKNQVSREETTTESNEREFKKINAKLRDLHQQIDAIPHTATEPGIGPQLVEANRSFDHATTAFRQKEWLTVIHELNNFLNLSQKPESRSWLKAQFMLGRAYEEQGHLQRATRAYTRYLATFTTKPTNDLSDLTETFERLVRIATKGSEANQAELAKFLSAISAMEYPSTVSEELRYLTAVASNNLGRKNMSISWLSDVDGRADAPETKARARYFRALIAISSREWVTASDQLEGLFSIDGLSQKTKDNARLSLGRVFLKQRKPELAIKNYNQISENSDAFRDASFEKIFALMKLQQDDLARTTAHQWLARYPEHDDATQLRAIASWLDLRTGDLASAKSSINGNVAKLTEIKTTIDKTFQGTKLQHEDAIRLSNMTRGQVISSPDLDQILTMFRQIGELKQRLTEVDGLERSIIYAIAKGNLRQFKPALENRMEQYDRLADEVLASGAKLIFIERQRLSATLSDLDKQKLEASEKRRTQLFDKRSQLARQAKRWATWVGPAEQLVKLATEWEKLNRIEAAAKSTSGLSDKDAAEATLLSEKITSARQDMIQTLTEIRQTQAGNIVEQSALNDILYVLQQYATALHDESKIIAAYEPQSGRVLDALDDEDSRSNWNLWLEVVASLNSNIKGLKMQAGKELADIFESLSKIDKQKSSLGRDIENLKNVLETYGGESLAGIIAHYDNALNQRLARQYKWAGDLEYLNYAKEKNTHEAVTKKKSLELQILNDNLKDMEQGGATQWPR